MFSGNDVSLADIAAVTKNDDAFGGNSIWAILLLILILGGRGFGYGDCGFSGGGYPSSVATSGEVQRAFDYAGTSAKLDNITSTNTAGFNDVVANITATGNAIQNAVQANSIAAMQNTNSIMSQLSNMAATNAQCLNVA